MNIEMRVCFCNEAFIPNKSSAFEDLSTIKAPRSWSFQTYVMKSENLSRNPPGLKFSHLRIKQSFPNVFNIRQKTYF